MVRRSWSPFSSRFPPQSCYDFCCCLFKPPPATIPKYAVTPVRRIALRNKTNVSGRVEYEKQTYVSRRVAASALQIGQFGRETFFMEAHLLTYEKMSLSDLDSLGLTKNKLYSCFVSHM